MNYRLHTFTRANRISAVWSQALFNYQDPAVARGLMKLKYSYNLPLYQASAPYFAEAFLELQQQLHPIETKWIIVPIPMTIKRRLQRRFNPTLELAKCLSRETNLPVYSVLRKSSGKTQGQYRTRRERKTGIKGRFGSSLGIKLQRLLVRNNDLIVDANIILIDDVITTGATMSEARETLLGLGAKNVVALAFAH